MELEDGYTALTGQSVNNDLIIALRRIARRRAEGLDDGDSTAGGVGDGGRTHYRADPPQKGGSVGSFTVHGKSECGEQAAREVAAASANESLYVEVNIAGQVRPTRARPPFFL